MFEYIVGHCQLSHVTSTIFWHTLLRQIQIAKICRAFRTDKLKALCGSLNYCKKCWNSEWSSMHYELPLCTLLIVDLCQAFRTEKLMNTCSTVRKCTIKKSCHVVRSRFMILLLRTPEHRIYWYYIK